MHVADLVECIRALDASQQIWIVLSIASYITLCQGFRDLRNAYSMILDKIEKNYEKLTNPKGVAAHMQHELLYQFICLLECFFLLPYIQWTRPFPLLRERILVIRFLFNGEKDSVCVIPPIHITLMKKDTKEQYSIIAKKNWIVIKRNPAELVVDILYLSMSYV